jgi:hypothetical protein
MCLFLPGVFASRPWFEILPVVGGDFCVAIWLFVIEDGFLSEGVG